MCFPRYKNIFNQQLSITNTYLSTVDLKERTWNSQIEISVVRVNKPEYVLGSQSVDTIRTVLVFPAKLASHCVRLTTASLPVSKTSCKPLIKNRSNQRLRSEPKFIFQATIASWSYSEVTENKKNTYTPSHSKRSRQTCSQSETSKVECLIWTKIMNKEQTTPFPEIGYTNRIINIRTLVILNCKRI